MIKIQYYYSITDEHNFVHSIDNIIFEYFLKSYNMRRISKELIEIRKKNNCDGWEKLNCSACSKYSFYQNIIHIGSIHISYGKMQSYDKINCSWDILPMLRIEVNPNKHYDKPEFKAIIDWITKNCTSGNLQRFDYTIDVPYRIDNIRVYGSRKEAGLYKGTIYRGQRAHHGFMKIYDKGKEQNNPETPLTRIEHTLDPKKPLSLEKIAIINTQTEQNDQKNKLDNLNKCIVTLCLTLQAHGIDFEPLIASLNYRRRKTLEPYLYDNCIELKYDSNIINALLNKINELFNADIELKSDNTKSTLDDFIQMDDLADEMPFD